MKIERLSYQKIFPLLSYVNEKIGAEATLDEGDTPEEVLSKLKSTVEDWHKSNHPELYQEGNEVSIPVTIQDRTQQTINQINLCSDVAALESFNRLANTYPEIKAAYDNKMKELCNKK